MRIMMNPKCFFLLLVTVAMPLSSFAEFELFIVERSSGMVQTGPNTLVPFGTYSEFEFGSNYTSWLEMIPADETVAGAQVATPGGVQALEFDAWDGSYLFKGEYVTKAEIEAAIPAGTYTFSGSGSTSGAVSEAITIGDYSGLSPLKVTNFAELQSVDVSQPLVIQWEEFTEGQGEGLNNGFAGVVNVEVWGFDEGGIFDVYDSEEVTPEGAFGLLPTTTQVTIPANRLKADAFHIVNIFFARIDVGDEAASSGLKAALTGYEIETNIYLQGQTPYWGNFAVDPQGWADTGSWLGKLHTRLQPWIWSDDLQKRLYILRSGLHENGGWVYFPKD